MPEPILLYGATGYTGQLVAGALCHRGLPFTIAGRDRRKLDDLARRLPWRPTVAVADLERPDSLLEALRGRRVVLNCAGPFELFGEPMVAAAIEAGVHYADTTGEAPFMLRIHERYDSSARRAGVAVVPAAAYEVALADCAASLLADEMPADEVEVLYALENLRTSVGTMRSALGVTMQGGLAYRNGRWMPERFARDLRLIPIPMLGRRMTAVTFPSGELATIPLHVKTPAVKTFMAVPSVAAPAIMSLAPVLAPLARQFEPMIEKRLSRRRSGPGEEHRQETTYTISVRVRRGARRAQAVVTGRDIYGITAWIQAYTAARLLEYKGPGGVLAPAQVLDPDRFFRELRSQRVVLHER